MSIINGDAMQSLVHPFAPDRFNCVTLFLARRTGAEMATINGDAMKRLVNTSTKRLGRPYVDLMQFYCKCGGQVWDQKAWGSHVCPWGGPTLA